MNCYPTLKHIPVTKEISHVYCSGIYKHDLIVPDSCFLNAHLLHSSIQWGWELKHKSGKISLPLSKAGSLWVIFQEKLSRGWKLRGKEVVTLKCLQHFKITSLCKPLFILCDRRRTAFKETSLPQSHIRSTIFNHDFQPWHAGVLREFGKYHLLDE